MLFILMEFTNQAETQRVIQQLQQMARLDGTIVGINLKTTGGSIGTQSMLRPPELLDTDISQALAIGDASVSPHYLAAPKGFPFKERVDAVRPKMRDIVQRQFKKRKGGPTTSRKEYMGTANQALRGVMRSNSIYDEWVRMITA